MKFNEGAKQMGYVNQSRCLFRSRAESGTMIAAFVMSLVMMLSACEKIAGDPSSETWMENVKLENGEVLKVKRTKKYAGGDAGTSGGPLVYSSLEFTYKSKKYFWESNNSSAYLLEIDDKGRPVVAGDIGYDWAWSQRGRPCDKGVVEYYENGKWNQIPSWEINVSTRLNLAADKLKGEKGVAIADEITPSGTHLKSQYYKSKCLIQKEGKDHVQ